MQPLLSIIIPLYNKQDSIAQSLESVLSQDFKEYEIVVVDDGSTDNSIHIVEPIHDERLHLYHKENGGPASARNYGVKMAKGEWLLFLDADDFLDEGALRLVADNIHTHKYADVFCYNLYVKTKDNKIIRNVRHTKGYLLFPFLHWYLNSIYPRTGNMVVKRSLLISEPYREDLRRHEDTENTFRLMRKYRFYACPLPLFCYNQDTLAASNIRENYREDFVCMMEPDGKSFGEQLAMFKLYCTETKWCYSKIADEKYTFFNKKRFIMVKKILSFYQDPIGVINRVLSYVIIIIKKCCHYPHSVTRR